MSTSAPLLAVCASAGSIAGCFAALDVREHAPASDFAPPFALTGADGHQVALVDALARGPTVLVFYRGYW
jgi:peroxiredoxin